MVVTSVLENSVGGSRVPSLTTDVVTSVVAPDAAESTTVKVGVFDIRLSIGPEGEEVSSIGTFLSSNASSKKGSCSHQKGSERNHLD